MLLLVLLGRVPFKLELQVEARGYYHLETSLVSTSSAFTDAESHSEPLATSGRKKNAGKTPDELPNPE